MPLPDAEAVAPSDPKELINAYLLSKGMQPTNALMSQALMANAQNPGVIPGLRNMEPISSPGDPGMPPAPSRGGGPARVPGASTRTSTDDRGAVAREPLPNAPTNPDDRSIGMRILDWLALPGAAAGNKYLLGGPQKPEPKQLAGPDKPGGGGDGGRPAPVPERPMLPGGGQDALPAPEPRAPLGLPAPTPRSPLDLAIDRAVPESVPAEAGKGPPPAVPPVAEPKGTVSVVDPKTIKPRTNLNLPSALQGKGAAQLEAYLRSIGRIHR